MSVGRILLVALIVAVVCGGFGGIYPRNYGLGGGGVLVVILIILLVLGVI